MTFKSTHNKKAGFSLLELLIALTVLSIISLIAVNRYTERSEDARSNAARAEAKAIADGMRQAEIDTGWFVTLRALDDYPGSGTVITETNGLKQYRIGDEPPPYAFDTLGNWYYQRIDTRNWKGPYINYQSVDTTGSDVSIGSYGSPLDPWGRPWKLFTPTQLSNPVPGETDYSNILDRYAIVSYGRDGSPGDRGTLPGQGDDIIYRF